MRIRGVMALAASAAIVVGACSSSGGEHRAIEHGRHERGADIGRQRAGERRTVSAAASGPLRTRSARARAPLNLVAWAGYVVGGTGGEQVTGYDWVTPFETETGCKVTVKVGLDSGNMVQLMKTGQYDGVSASGDATLRLIAGGDVAPVDFNADPQLRGRLRGPQEPALQHGRTASATASRTAAAPTS